MARKINFMTLLHAVLPLDIEPCLLVPGAGGNSRLPGCRARPQAKRINRSFRPPGAKENTKVFCGGTSLNIDRPGWIAVGAPASGSRSRLTRPQSLTVSVAYAYV